MFAEHVMLADGANGPTLDERRHACGLGQQLPSGYSFARYRVSRCIGVGGMGTVYEATHTLLRKRVAIKAMHSVAEPDGVALRRFLREAEMVARVRHPNVVDITDVGIEQGIPFLVMEYLEGEDLAALLAREGKLSPQRAVNLVLPAVAGLAAAHRVGIVHRDVKPENVFLAAEPLGDVVVKVVDFGVSKDLSASALDVPETANHAAGRHTVAGTPQYMAPEQVRGSNALDARTDQYALGILLYQCLTGARPFEAESLLALAYRIDAGVCRPLLERCPDLPSELAAIVARAMAPRMEDRFPSTEAFGQALSSFASPELRDAYARDFAPERRSSAPPPRHPGAPVLPATCAGWIHDNASAGSCAAPRSRRATPSGILSVATLALVVGSLLWRAVEGAPSAAPNEPSTASIHGSSRLPLELSTPLGHGFDVAGACRSVRVR
jgi:serine/threonine protein kinase